MNKGILLGIAIASLLAAIGVLLFSTSMETLDRVAEQLGFEELVLWNPIFPDYTVPGNEESIGANLILSLISTIMVFCIAYIFGRILVFKKGKR